MSVDLPTPLLPLSSVTRPSSSGRNASTPSPVLAEAPATHETQIDRLSSYADGVFLSRRVYNWCLGIFICSLVANAVFIILTVMLWLNK